MSEHRLRLGTEPLRVAFDRIGDAAQARVDDVSHAITRVVVGPRQRHAGATTDDVRFDLDGVPQRAVVTRHRDRLLVALDGQVYVFHRGDAAGAAAGALGSGTVVAPMPGKVIKVLVAEGDTVEIGQGLVVIEAMKMESTLVAEIAGTVRAVHATAGGVVDGGATLVEIVPPAGS